MTAKAYENPLIPNQRLREMYIAMVQVRLLGKRKSTAGSISRGHEAVWSATAIGLRDAIGDLVSETGAGTALDLILGAELKKIASGKAVTSPHRLPALGRTPERVQLALGAAMALRAAAQRNVLLIYLDQADLPRTAWRAALGTALAGELPIVFVVSCAEKATFDLAALSQARGVPGIAVDASDAIALYRVAQESIGRARADGGPALIAAVPFRFSSVKRRQPDPIALLGSQLLQRGVCTQTWLDAVEQKAAAALSSKPAAR